MTNGRLLLIEDEPALARGLSDTLRAHGFDVTVANDGARGLARLTCLDAHDAPAYVTRSVA